MYRDLDRFKPLPKVEKSKGDLVLVIHCRTGQPWFGKIDEVYYGYDVLGKPERKYSVKLVLTDRYINSNEWEMVSTGEF